MVVEDFSSIPEEALEKLKDCTTAEEVMDLAQQYDIEITQEEAEAALAAGGEDLERLTEYDCNCGHCKAYTYGTGYCSTHGNSGYKPNTIACLLFVRK